MDAFEFLKGLFKLCDSTKDCPSCVIIQKHLFCFWNSDTWGCPTEDVLKNTVDEVKGWCDANAKQNL